MSSDTHYEFLIPEKDELSFQVVSFKGYEALSQPFHFTFELYSENSDLAVRQLLGKKASFTLQVLGKSRTVHGMVAYCRILHPIEKGYLYQLRMVPRLNRLEMIQTNEIYLEQTLTDTLTEILEEGEFSQDEFDLQQLGDYRQWEYRCQFGESHLSFLQRITEREGIYYRFEHLDEHARVIFHDASSQHLKDPQTQLRYQPETGMVPKPEDGLLSQWISHGEPLPRSITLKDYNSNTPSSQIQGQAQVDEQGFGSIYRYCDNLISSEEAEKIAETRAQELMMKSEIFHGASRDASLQTGLAFTVEGHFRAADNGDFYPFVLEHEGFNPAFRRLQNDPSSQAPYQNRIQALRTSLQFRPSVTTEKPRFHGVLNAIIDGGEDERYAHIDAEGRYKVILPFDRERVPGEGKASCWIAMMQPSAGTGGGMHFPLLKGTEVLLSFIGGDPDRPIISGALPNAACPSVVKDENKTRSLLRSASGNRIELEDEEGNSRLKLFSPTNNTYLHLGAPNHSGDGFTITSDGLYRYEMLGGSQTLVFAKGHEVDDKGVDKFPYESEDDTSDDHDKFDEQELFAFPKFSKESGGEYEDATLTREEELSGEYIISRQAGHQYHWADGDVYNFGGDGREFSFGGGDESLTFFVEPDDARYEKMEWDVPNKPSGTENWGFEDGIDGDDTAWSPGSHYVEKSWGNTFTYQMGNNYSWGDTADYDFGNGYEEAHIDEDIAGGINKKTGNDKADKGGPYLTSINGNNVSFSDPGKVAIAKTYGNSYEYTKGDTLEVQDGKSESHQHGDSFEYSYGLSKSIHHGRVEEMFMGGTVELSLAGGKSISLAAESEIYGGLQSSIFAGGTSEISLSLGFELSLSISKEIYAGHKSEVAIGTKFTADTAIELNTTVMNVEAEITKLQTTTTKVNNALVEVANSTAGVKSVKAKINNSLAAINSAGLTMIN
ncbi:MAG: type VI secretion system tip protein VgrG [Marinospirillum sp.]|uniref:type VI secretion system Vgr family protein n=1 Tax=Marinospirillum sp. TaxID=2183934 RepID=UPI001A0560C5|nr:type VI secretion system tip protein TssI/VgrG [Marinospirillum sp.]MBE0506337.1 type VI secretion system tip protein VgrG [Marinospirillum sp.]